MRVIHVIYVLNYISIVLTFISHHHVSKVVYKTKAKPKIRKANKSMKELYHFDFVFREQFKENFF